MKILILQDRLRLGGTETQALALGAQWLAAGHEVRLVVFRPGGDLANSSAAKKLQPKVLQFFDSHLDGWAPGLGRAVKKFAPEVVVAFGREANAKLPLLQNLSPRPLLVATLRSGRSQPERFWNALRGADLLIANAQWTAQEAIKQGVASEKINVIYNGLAQSPLVDDPAQARADGRKRANTPEDAVVLVCVAGFRRGKGQDILLRAVAELPANLSWQLWLVGDGPTLPHCKRIARKLKSPERVRFAGQVKNPAWIYAASDVAVLASEAEALPNFLIEAQATGLPVVAVSVGGVPECFVEGVTGFGVPAGNDAALTEALARAIRSRGWRKSAKEPAQARAAELFDARRNAAKWIELFAAKNPKR
jgi:glycosyltransferase involved in cell wall biosynthesis